MGIMDDIRGELIQWIPKLGGHQVLVVGDLFLDEYVLGQAARLSREAPIPVLEFVRRFYVPGGAANPAHNVCALGSRATVVGLIGRDGAGEQLLAELDRAGIDSSGVVEDAARPTTTKMRVMAEGSLRFPQQLARVDHVDRSPVSGATEAKLRERLESLLPQADAVLVSDYQTGVASPTLVQAVLSLARAGGKPCCVDAQGSFHKYAGFDLVKGNRQEIEAALGWSLRGDDDYSRAGEHLIRDLGVATVIITRGAEGLSAISRDGSSAHVPAVNRTEVFDVTGAGDTVIAVATLALLAGAGIAAAARLANSAAGLVVRKLGNAVVSGDELATAIENC